MLVGHGSAGTGVSLHDTRLHVHKEQERGVSAQQVPDARLSDVPCAGGRAGPFACDGIDLLSFVPLPEFSGVEIALLGGGASDIWGWVDRETGDEYVIIGTTSGAAFFRVTDPGNPVHLGNLPNTGLQLIWHDIKVYDDHAFIVSESQPHGMRVFDLTRLRGVMSPQTWTENARYPLSWAAHNIAINEETGFAYIVGGNEGLVLGDHCRAGLHMVDIRQPLLPLFAGCYADDGYVHDTQCVIYRGPDAKHRGREICFNSSEDRFTIVDVTDKLAPVLVGTLLYPNTGYTHQGWLTADQRHFLLGDEDDENQTQFNTRTVVVDVRNLDAPRIAGSHFHNTASIDHNMYVRGKHVYQSNYSAGLRVLALDDVARGRLREVAFFDTYPSHDRRGFVGTWSNYPFFPSGTIAVSGIDEGLFLLRVRPGAL